MFVRKSPNVEQLPRVSDNNPPLSENTAAQSFARPFRIFPQVKNYAWGMIGERALVCRLARTQRPEVVAIDGVDGTPFAELWYGTHPSGSAIFYDESGERSLRDAISRQPREILGADLAERFGAELPFLFKVLSVGAPLSIQAHPNKKQAEVLHRRDPAHYPDDNHKPEMAIALTNLELLYGFRPREALQPIVESVSAFKTILGENWSAIRSAADQKFYRLLTSTLLQADSTLQARACSELVLELRSRAPRTSEESWILRAAELYPSDAGLFSFYLLNYFSLPAGAVVYIGPGIPHAYLSGDLAECMSTSDNVVRAGLTPKFKDAAALAEILHFASDSSPEIGRVRRGQRTEFRPPVKEFAVDVIECAVDLRSSGGAEAVFVLSGELRLRSVESEHSLRAGDAYLIPAAVSAYALLGESFCAVRVFTPPSSLPR